MQQALPYKTWQPSISTTFLNQPSLPFTPSSNPSSIISGVNFSAITNIPIMVSENPIIVFGKRGCCMSHVVKRLLQGLGVNPAVYDVDEDDEVGVVTKLESIGVGGGDKDGKLQLPAVFIGGRLFGGLERVMATHITGELVPKLKQAGALWL